MKRDLDLIKEILLKVEAYPVGRSLSRIEVEGYKQDVISEHIRLLQESNYIDVDLLTSPSSHGVNQVDGYSINRLLNDGHDFIANAKSESVWTKAKSLVKEKGIDVSLAVFKAVLAKVTMQELGIA